MKRSGDCGDIWVDGDLVFGAIAAAGAAFAWLLYQELTMMRRRRRRSSTNKILVLDHHVSILHDLVAIGNDHLTTARILIGFKDL